MSSSHLRAPHGDVRAARVGPLGVRLGYAVVACLFLMFLSRPAIASSVSVPSPVRLGTADTGVEVIVYPPRDRSAPRPVTVMLHGMCDEPEQECPHFASVVTRSSWLVCPRASMRCSGGGSIWDYRVRHQTVERAVQLVHQTYPGELDESHGRTLIGFSLGALFGLDVGHRGAFRYPRLLLIGAKVEPYARLLQREGVTRVVFAAGDRDMMSSHMREQARKLDRLGVAARFESMGDVGHWFPPDLDQRLPAILAWLEAAETDP